MSPFPALDFGHVIAVPANELLVLNQLVANRLLGVCGPRSELWYAINHVGYEVEAIKIVQNAHVERGCGGAFFLIAAHMQVAVARAPVCQPVNQFQRLTHRVDLRVEPEPGAQPSRQPE